MNLDGAREEIDGAGVVMFVSDAGAAPKLGDHDQQLPIGLFDHLAHICLRRCG